MPTQLCPAQQRAFDGLRAALPLGNLFAVQGDGGSGKTTVLRAMHRTAGGIFMTMKEFVDAMRPRHPLAMEETFAQWLTEALTAHDCVFLDDLNLISDVVQGCGSYPRAGFLEAPLTALAAQVVEAGQKLFVGCGHYPPGPIRDRSYDGRIGDFEPADYEFLCRAYLDAGLAGRLDYARVHRFAPNLNAHQLKWVAVSLRHDESLDTHRFINFLLSHHLISNVDLDEVQKVTLKDLHGVEDVIRGLETNIILPLENDELATEFNLKPKRGVLLVGPPGTGKTTVGRALAHRLKSKFFLVDGTFISGTGAFYQRIQGVFETAKRNAPSIIFIDDSDAIFESGEELGLYRYLLTMLDGLESESAGRVCVMMTAMDVGHLPPALIRSGRIELWLEMRLPDVRARAAILSQCLRPLPPVFRDTVDLDRVVAATEGFTGADLKRLVEDGKNLFAYDKVQGLPLRSLTAYLCAAVAGLCANRERYAEAETVARQQRPSRPAHCH
ncbi:MAG TPA: ATP-binding protein [Gemmataceae bacterium]|jgi:predicted AAA+ superfamily ATPase|nr:ATP-binding protein [Gemmataceae bacterium]